MRRRVAGNRIWLTGIVLAGIGLRPFTTGRDAGGATEPARVTYHLEWDWGSASPAPDGAGWRVVNDLGYRVRVRRGYIVNYSLALSESEPPDPDAGRASTGFRDAWSMPVALAGHSNGRPDPTAVELARVESLAAPEAFEVPTLRVPPARYAKFHYLVARANYKAVNLPEDVDMSGLSLYLQGCYQAPKSETWRPFEIKSSMANGALRSLSDGVPGGELNTGTHHADIHVRRDLGRLFDGLDFQETPTRRRPWRILSNLITFTTVTLDLEPIDGEAE